MGVGSKGLPVACSEVIDRSASKVSMSLLEDIDDRGGMGATLTLLTTGAQAPMLEMQKDQLRERVNAVYGYNAIARIRITQTAATGFEDGQVVFDHRPKDTGPKQPEPEATAAAGRVVAPVEDETLRAALERLGAHILTKEKQGTRT